MTTVSTQMLSPPSVKGFVWHLSERLRSLPNEAHNLYETVINHAPSISNTNSPTVTGKEIFAILCSSCNLSFTVCPCMLYFELKFSSELRCGTVVEADTSQPECGRITLSGVCVLSTCMHGFSPCLISTYFTFCRY